jgi:glyoxylase-like metal-dependent hydrolase (beta-lactamase superfamily II)
MEREILAVRYGTRTTTRSETFFNHHFYGEPDGPLTMDYYFWVVRDGAEVQLVDCGFGAAAGRRRRRTMMVDPIEALRGLGVAPEDVSRVVVSHAHYDHIGNLERFPAAEVVLARREYEFWTGPYAGRPQFAVGTEPDELAQLVKAAADGRLRLVDDTATVAPGIEVVVVGGHTPGQMVAQVHAGEQAVVLATDAVHLYEEVERDMPFAALTDLEGMYRGFDVLREMTEDVGRVLVPGHDAAVPDRFPDRPAGLPAELDGLVVRLAGTDIRSGRN